MNSDPRVTRFLTPDGSPHPPAFTDEQLARFRRGWQEHGFGIWALEERASGRLVGRVGLSYHRIWPEDVELGWKVDANLWGRGYATEAGGAAMRHAFETVGLRRLVSIIHPGNVASIRVAEKLGARPHASVRWEPPGVDLLVYAASP